MRTVLLSLTALLLLSASLGCTSQAGGGPDAPVQAIAVPASEAPPPDAVGQALDPQSLIVLVGNATTSCADPYLAPWHVGNECSGSNRSEWQVFVVVPPAAQQPGSIALDDP